jgi:hypothetical protein
MQAAVQPKLSSESEISPKIEFGCPITPRKPLNYNVLYNAYVASRDQFLGKAIMDRAPISCGVPVKRSYRGKLR